MSITNNFVAGHQQLELAEAQLVNDLARFEEMKLRMLNDNHSFLPWLGYLAGFAHISDGMNETTLRAAVEKLMVDEQVLPCTPFKEWVPGTTPGNTRRVSLTPMLKHRTWKIVMDSNPKLP